MLDDVKEALAAEKLDCKPIKGHDFPLASKNVSKNQQKVGLGGAELVEVVNMDTFNLTLDPNPQKAELTDHDKMLQMLLPSQLKAPKMAFLDEDDINGEDMLRKSTKELPKAPLTGFQKERLNKKEYEKEQEKIDAIGPEERERTIKCLLKVMNYQLEGVEHQYQNMTKALKKNDKELIDYQKELKDRQD